MTDRDDPGGTYILLVALTEPTTIEVGALGSHHLEAGHYAYVGSARGPGGFARLDRHREVAAGERETRHWHVDYLLGQPAASVAGDRTSAGVAAECAVADSLASRTRGEAIAGFGCSDCGCDTHLFTDPTPEALVQAVERAHAAVETETG